MPKSANPPSPRRAALNLLLAAACAACQADPYASQIIAARLTPDPAGCRLNAEIDYNLSPESKTALRKGVPLAWNLIIRIDKSGWLFKRAIREQHAAYLLQYNALLNQYELKSPNLRQTMFQTLNAALNDMSRLQLLLDGGQPCRPEDGGDEEYRLALRLEFDRDMLPAPLRPETYLNPQWFLSSDWFLWTISK